MTVIEDVAPTAQYYGLFNMARIDEADPKDMLQGVWSEQRLCGIGNIVSNACRDAVLVANFEDGDLVLSLQTEETGPFVFFVNNTPSEPETGPNPEYTISDAADGLYQVQVRLGGVVVASMSVVLPLTGEQTSAMKDFGGRNFELFTPFTITDGVVCDLFSMEESRQLAEERLTNARQYLAERHLWETLFPAATDVTPTPGTPVSITTGIALLMEATSAVYAGTPIIHMHPAVAMLGAKDNVPAAMMATVLGAGYFSKVGPGGRVAGSGQYWIYATGPISVRQGQVSSHVVPQVSNNQGYALAEQELIATVDCFRFGVLVSNS